MQNFPDLANRDNDAIPARELLNAGIEIRFMDEQLRWAHLPGEVPTVVYGKLGNFIFTRMHECWIATHQWNQPIPGYWARHVRAELEYGRVDVGIRPSARGVDCYRAYTPRALEILRYRCENIDRPDKIMSKFLKARVDAFEAFLRLKRILIDMRLYLYNTQVEQYARQVEAHSYLPDPTFCEANRP